jgi:HSP20 family protein
MLVRWTPSYDPFLSDFRSLSKQMDRVFRDLLPMRELAPRRSTWNLVDDGERYVVTAALPGIKKDELSIEATENELTIKGKRSLEAPEGYRAVRRERGELAFEESFSFDTALDLDKIEAKLDNGMLRIELTKQAKARPRSIAVKAA